MRRRVTARPGVAEHVDLGVEHALGQVEARLVKALARRAARLPVHPRRRGQTGRHHQGGDDDRGRQRPAALFAGEPAGQATQEAARAHGTVTWALALPISPAGSRTSTWIVWTPLVVW